MVSLNKRRSTNALGGLEVTLASEGKVLLENKMFRVNQTPTRRINILYKHSPEFMYQWYIHGDTELQCKFMEAFTIAKLYEPEIMDMFLQGYVFKVMETCALVKRARKPRKQRPVEGARVAYIPQTAIFAVNEPTTRTIGRIKTVWIDDYDGTADVVVVNESDGKEYEFMWDDPYGNTRIKMIHEDVRVKDDEYGYPSTSVMHRKLFKTLVWNGWDLAKAKNYVLGVLEWKAQQLRKQIEAQGGQL